MTRSDESASVAITFSSVHLELLPGGLHPTSRGWTNLLKCDQNDAKCGVESADECGSIVRRRRERRGRLRFHLLGRLEAYRDGVEVELGPRKQRAVLALLLLNVNRVVPTERLIDDLWGDSPPSTARSALQVYIAGLRKALAKRRGSTTDARPGYVLELEQGALDVERFAQLRRGAGIGRRRAARKPPPRGARALARRAARRATDRALLRGRRSAAGGAPARDARGADRSRPRARPPRRPRRRARQARRGESVPRATPRAADARALPVRPPDGRARGLPGRPPRARDELGLEPSKELRELEAAILHHDERLARRRRAVSGRATASSGPTSASRGRNRRGVATALVAATALLVLRVTKARPSRFRRTPSP